MAAKKAKILSWGQKELNLDSQKIGLCGSPTQVVKIFTPEPRQGGQMFSGEAQEIADKLASLLKDEIH